MPPKQKQKKGGLDDTQIKTTVGIVKQYWPDYSISVADIRNPHRDFVLKFYTECVHNLDEKCAFVTRSNLISYPPGLGEEELLYLKLSRIPSLVIDADFKLGDLFTFDPKRLNNHIFVTMHFLIFTETVMDKMVKICNNVFDTKEEMCKNLKELEELKEEKTQKLISLTLAKSENKQLKEAAAVIAPKYEETLALIEESKRNCKDSIFEANKLKSELENVQEEIQKREKTELYLKTQIVTEEEYKNLKDTVESLANEEQNLEEINTSNGLLEQKQHIEQLQMCLQELKHLHLPKELFKLSDLRVQLRNEQQNLEYALAIQQSSTAEIEQLKIQLEAQKHLLQTQNKSLQKTLKDVSEKAITKELNLKKSYQQAAKVNQSEIEKLKTILEQYEADYKRLKIDLFEKYKSICKTQDMVLERFQNFLHQVNQRITRKDEEMN